MTTTRGPIPPPLTPFFPPNPAPQKPGRRVSILMPAVCNPESPAGRIVFSLVSAVSPVAVSNGDGFTFVVLRKNDVWEADDPVVGANPGLFGPEPCRTVPAPDTAS